MRIFGLIGYPLGHSFSKKYFTEKFLREKIENCIYELFPLQDLAAFTDLIRKNPDLCGLNVTIPHKTEVMKFADQIDPEAREIGAVNVLKITRKANGVLIHGFNSDVTGIRETLSPYLGKIKKAIILGTGGSSLAVKHVLKKWDIEVLQVSRTVKPGIITYGGLSREIISEHQLLVNTTPLGMFPRTDTKPDIDYPALTGQHILFDLVYNPEETAFLQMGKERGCTTLSGMKMLWSQAERSWEIWNDEEL